MTGTDTLFFDADGTILDFRKTEREALESLRGSIETSLPPEEFRKAYHGVNDRLWVELEQGAVSASELKIERFRRFADLLNIPTAPEALSDLYLKRLGEGSYFLPGALEMLRKLKGHYRMAVLTNGLTVVQEARFNRPEFRELFEQVLISEKEGTAKPDADMFRRAADRMGMPLSDRIMMIGDSLTSDIAGGINAGIRTCWYNPGGWKNQSPWKPDMEASGFDELLKMLLPGTAPPAEEEERDGQAVRLSR